MLTDLNDPNAEVGSEQRPSGNWRLTFEVVNKAIEHLEVEDYH